MDQEKEAKQNISDEHMDALLDLMELLPLPSLSPNDLCWCGSGKKYKKCCLEKTINPPSSKIIVESFTIKEEALTPEESKNNFPPMSVEDQKTMSTLHQNAEIHPDMINSEDCEYFHKLNALLIKYPDNPMVLNFLTLGYHHLGQTARTEELIVKTYEKFPDYLFAITAQANLHLKNGFPEKAIEVFKGAYTLKQLYPNRSVFHISEITAFEYFMVRYFCRIGNLNQAEAHLQIMQKVLEKNNISLIDSENTFRKAKALRNFKANVSYFFGHAKKKNK